MSFQKPFCLIIFDKGSPLSRFFIMVLICWIFVLLRILVKEVLPNGLLRYSSGIFSTIEEAEKKRYQLLRKGFKHAFISAYYKGKKITLSKAKSITSD